MNTRDNVVGIILEWRLWSRWSHSLFVSYLGGSGGGVSSYTPGVLVTIAL